MLCHYCTREATGINYRPNKTMTNTPTCSIHATALFIPFFTQINTATIKNSPTPLQQLFSKLIDSVIGEFNLLKAEALQLESQASKLSPNMVESYVMKCDLTNPYMIINLDEELVLSALLKRIKSRFDRQKINRQRTLIFQRKSIQKQQRKFDKVEDLLNMKSKLSKSTYVSPAVTERTPARKDKMKGSVITHSSQISTEGRRDYRKGSELQ